MNFSLSRFNIGIVFSFVSLILFFTMLLFSNIKNKISPSTEPVSPINFQNAYTCDDAIEPSPPPPPFHGRSFNKSVTPGLYVENADIEKFNHQRLLMAQAEANRLRKQKKLTYSRLFCCFCFPCLPMWTRTICCFMFLAICGVIGLSTIFITTFQKPQIMFNGYMSDFSGNSSTANILKLQYSVYNGNFFELNFDNIKAVAYYPSSNSTTIGVGEISNLLLGPLAVTNVTFPVELMGNNVENSKNLNIADNNKSEKVFTNMVIDVCSSGNSTKSTVNSQKDFVIVFDLMPTIKICGYSLFTLAFTGQETKMSCEKLKSIVEKSKSELPLFEKAYKQPNDH